MNEGEDVPPATASGADARFGPTHMASRPWYLTVPALVGAVLVVLVGAGVGLAVGLSSGPSRAQRQAEAAAAAARRADQLHAQHEAEAQELAADVSISPTTGSTGVALDSAIKIIGGGGTLTAVAVTGGGVSVPGTLDSATGEWTPSNGLAPGTAYTVKATITFDGVAVIHSSTFTTLNPSLTAEATVYPDDGMTVGVGQPIVVSFDHPVTTAAAQAAIENRFTVAMGDPQPGAWYWFSDEELHFRPLSFWTAHQKVEVSADLNGIDLGDGVWTAGSVLDTFGIGDARISYANLQTEEMTVTLNGATVYRFPISGGRPEYPTMNGIHIVLDKEPVVHMVSSTVGIPVDSANGYDEYVYNDVHISQSGEYVHAAPWSVYAQGVENVSHGCINVSTADSLSFYNFSEVGDVVEVTGSVRPPLQGDEGVMDWSGPAWSQWTSAHVAELSPTGTVEPTTTSTSTSTTTSTTTAPPSSSTDGSGSTTSTTKP